MLRKLRMSSLSISHFWQAPQSEMPHINHRRMAIKKIKETLKSKLKYCPALIGPKYNAKQNGNMQERTGWTMGKDNEPATKVAEQFNEFPSHRK